jgi:choline dehydrogenase-like flavoprotein
MTHVSPGVYATFPLVSNEGFGPGPGVAIDDFYGKNPGIVGGGIIYSRTEVTPIVFTRIRPDGAPTWGRAHKQYQRENFHRYIRLTAVGEDLPQFENRVEVSPIVCDAWGIPVARITHGFHANDYLVWDFLERKMVGILEEAGAQNLATRSLRRGGVGVHQNGTCRLGEDPKTSVVSKYGQSHEVDNLFVVDASCFVTSGGRNPALCIQALAYRFADYIVRQWSGGAWRKGRSDA